MKNLLIFIGTFDKEHEELTKIQIDNSLELGWKAKDIVLAMNFDWEYRGVKAAKVGGNLDALDGNRSSKIPVILKLDLTDDIYWFHDQDAFQLEPFSKVERGFTDHGWSGEWNAGSFFFTKEDLPLFKQIYDTMLERNTNEQGALTYLWENGVRTNKLNITYNLNIYHLVDNLNRAEQPFMVAHFHPHKQRHLELFKRLLPLRLSNIFKAYGLK